MSLLDHLQEHKIASILTISETAKSYLNDVRGDAYISLSVKGGGCSGFQYQWDITQDADNLIEGIINLDPMAEMFVAGCTIDYVKELGGSYLKVINPNATASCGCGESFAV